MTLVIVTCPVSTMKKYLYTVPRSCKGPLFVFAIGKRLTRQHLTRERRYLLSRLGPKSSNYAGHCTRIGAVTSAAALGLPSWLIKTLGLWTSDCFKTYISITSILVFCQATQKLGSTCTKTPSVTAQQNSCHISPLLQLQITYSIRSNIPPVLQSLISYQNKNVNIKCLTTKASCLTLWYN